MKLKTFAAVLVATLTGGMAAAQTVDISTITCADLDGMDADTVTALLFWVDGYQGGAAGDTSFDLERLKTNIDGAAAACMADPTTTVLDAIVAAEEEG